MILEHALLQVRSGQEAAFEAALTEATTLIAASSGFLGMELRPAIEQQCPYLLVVRWQSIPRHRDGFRHSDRYQEWRALPHHFYDPMPTFEYFGDAL